MAEAKPLENQEEAVQDIENRTETPVDQSGVEGAPDIQHAKFENFEGDEAKSQASSRKLNMLMDVMLPVTIELGRTQMYIKKILELERGSIIELDKMAGEPVDLYINNKKMAEGEVVVVDKHFGVRITNLIDPEDRIKNLGSQ